MLFLLRALCAFILLISIAGAQDFLNDAEHVFFDEAARQRRTGLEIEFSAVDDATIERILAETLHAKVISRNAKGEVEFVSPYGEVKLKIEGQAWRYEEYDPDNKYAEQLEIDKREAPREIVLPPMVFKDAHAIQALADQLEEHGAIGTTPRQAVSTQVNVEMPPLRASQKNVDALVNLMRIYSNPEHARQIQDKIRVPKIRREYIQDFSPGFLKKLADPNYRPTARRLYLDYFYRQSLELLGYADAWTMPTNRAKKLLLSLPDPVVPRVVKMTRLRVSSVLLLAFPEDPMTKIIEGRDWARGMPIVEFREFNTDFKILSTIKRALGVVRSAEVFGNYEHDALVSEITGVDSRDLELLRQYQKQGRYIVRYSLYDPKTHYMPDINFEEGKVIWIHLNPTAVGHRPLVVDGKGVVYGRRPIHRDTIVGQYNPGLENMLIQQVMENKILESKMLEHYAPGAMPRGRTLEEISSGKKLTVEELVEALTREFPNGWVMKGAWDLATERMLISDKLDMVDLIKKYEKGFEKFRAKVEKKMAGRDPEEILQALKKHAGYRGWKIVEMLSSPELVFFQERVAIKKEFRVEVIGGKVLGRGSTIDRYAYLKSGRKKRPTPAEIRGAERFTQSVVDQLPEALRSIPFGFDVALLRDGTWRVIETNPGGNSSFLEENEASIKALDRYLARYPRLVREGKVRSLSRVEQMKWIQEHFRMFGMDSNRHYADFEFTPDDIRDGEFERVKIDSKLCQRLLLHP